MTEEAKKEAKRAYMRAWKKANREKVNASKRQWMEANAESQRVYNQAYQAEYQSKAENQFATWVHNLRRNYRMTPAQFNAMWEKQKGKCAICEISMAPRGRSSDAACVDHNHKTKEVRGLLCRTCNHGLGHFKDSPEVIQAAIKYLQENGHYAFHYVKKES